MRSVAAKVNVALFSVQHWVQRAGGQRLDRVDWSDRADDGRPPPPQAGQLGSPLVPAP